MAHHRNMEELAKLSSHNTEKNLLDYVSRLDGQEDKFLAVHIFLSRLQNHHRRPHYMQAAIKIFEHHVRAFEGRMFLLANQDIIFVCHQDKRSGLEQALEQLCDFFPSDPLVRLVKSRDEFGRIAGWFDLGKDLKSFTAVVKKLMEDRLLSEKGGKTDLTPDEFKQPASINQFFDLIPMLEKVNIGDFIRSQPICHVIDPQFPVEVFHERFVSIHEIQRSFMPQFNLHDSRWLFQYMTQTLDRKMLAYLEDEAQFLKYNFSINMNVPSLLSEEFQMFEERISSKMRGRVIIEMQVADMLTDIRTFNFAKDFLKDLGFRLALDGLDHDVLSVLRMDKFTFDFYKIFWNMNLASVAKEGSTAHLRNILAPLKPEEMIMARCDSLQAIEIGQELGVALFQGVYLDKIIKDNKAEERRRTFNG